MTGITKLQIKGLVRFSYLAAGPAQRKSGVSQAEMDRFFHADRMDMAFALFEYFALPSLRRQTDQGFKAAILTTEGCPEPMLDRLLGQVEKMPNITVAAVPPMALGMAAGRALKLIPTEDDVTHVLNFRLEEDSALHDSTVATLRDRATRIIPMQVGTSPFAISFARGYDLDLSAPAGSPRLFDVHEKEPQPIGLATVSSVDEPLHAYRYGHRKLAQLMSLWSEMSEPMFLRSRSSGAGAGGDLSPANPETAAKRLADGFGLSYHDLENG